jgi:thiol-disulfide isomerase/thioredoxin
MDKVIKISALLFAAIILCTVLAFVYPGVAPGQTLPESAGSGTPGKVIVYFFYGQECPHCEKVMPFMQSLPQKYPDVDFRMLETWHNETNNELSTTLNQQLGVSNPGVPEVIVGKVVLVGSKDIPEKLEQAILTELKKR